MVGFLVEFYLSFFDDKRKLKNERDIKFDTVTVTNFVNILTKSNHKRAWMKEDEQY